MEEPKNSLERIKDLFYKRGKLLLVLIIILMLIPIGIIYVKNKYAKKTSPSSRSGFQNFNSSFPFFSLSPDKGTLTLKTSDNKKIYSVKDTITILLIGNSMKQTIVGYDAYLQYDTSFLNYTGGKTLLDDFTTIRRTIKNGSIITAVEKSAVKKPYIFTDTPLFEMTFIPKKIGNASLQLIYPDGTTNKSTLINTNSKNMLGQVRNITFTITK